jgi:hypothetical protein
MIKIKLKIREFNNLELHGMVFRDKDYPTDFFIIKKAESKHLYSIYNFPSIGAEIARHSSNMIIDLFKSGEWVIIARLKSS